jgi:predicted extracellular nuclease
MLKHLMLQQLFYFFVVFFFTKSIKEEKVIFKCFFHKIIETMNTAKYFTVILLFISISVSAQSGGKTFFVASYNVENLFDTIDDPTTDDAQFLPSDDSKWDSEKYTTKLNNLAQVIDSMNGGVGPDVLGLVEVENRGVIEELLKKLYKGKNYEIVHFESPDMRGIDCALIFNKGVFSLQKADTAVVTLADNWKTRSILHATLSSKTGVSYHFFVNHWPSRRGGSDKSEISRIAAANRLRNEVDKLYAKDPLSKIIIMGDFNDEPTDISITEYLRATTMVCPVTQALPNDQLYNLAAVKKSQGEGSYKFQGNWSMIDQMIVSGGLANNGYLCETFGIFNPKFIQQKGGKYEGASLPTFGGKKYFGGYSDHFAIFAIFNLQ